MNLRKHIKFVFSSIFFLVSASAYNQGRLVFNNDAYMVIDNGAFVVIDNPSADAITEAGSGGRIVSESELDRVKWNIGTSTGIYLIPWSTAAGAEFPLSVSIIAGGTGAGNITFSTYPGAIWDNDTYRPSDVTHMFDYATGLINNSDNVIDRFWIVDALGYGTKPDAAINITYLDAEWVPAGNNIVESDLGAQRFNSSAGIWGDYLPAGAVNTATNVVVGIPVSPANFFRSWTLSEISNPLSVELLEFKLSCNETSVNVKWTTANESDLQHYILAGSNNGINYTEIKKITPVGSSGITTYEETVSNTSKYYALISVETNGTSKTEAVETVSCQNESNVVVFVQQGNLIAELNLEYDDDVLFGLYDARGKLVKQINKSLPGNRSRFDLGKQEIAEGIYFLRIVSSENNLEKTVKVYWRE